MCNKPGKTLKFIGRSFIDWMGNTIGGDKMFQLGMAAEPCGVEGRDDPDFGKETRL